MLKLFHFICFNSTNLCWSVYNHACFHLHFVTCRVSCLNEEIAHISRIPVDKQVLLMSGGVPLFPDKPLAHYESVLVRVQCVIL